MKLEGTLDTFPLRELIDMVSYSSVTGALNVYGPDSSGHLYFRDGQLYHADCGAERGLDAMARMLEYERGLFAFVSDVMVGEETLWGSIDTHLQAADRLAQRWRQVRAYVPSLDLIPELLLPRDAAQRRVGPSHFDLLNLVDGRASVRALAESMGWSEIDVAEAVAQISLDGVISLRRVAAGPAAPARGLEGARQEGGIFDRLLAHAGVGMPSPQPAAVPATSGAAVAQAQRPISGAEETILRLLRS